MGERGAEPISRLIAAGLEALEIPTHRIERAVPRLSRLCDLVHGWSLRLNLTGHSDRASIAMHLILDAVALETVLPPARSLVDIGSGAGFPGIPIAILRAETSVLLIEARERRQHFLRTAIRELGLLNVRALHGRAEVLNPELADGAVAQATGPFAEAVEWLARWTAPGGFAAIPINPEQKLPPIPPSIASANLLEYRVPLTGRRRAVWIGARAVP